MNKTVVESFLNVYSVMITLYIYIYKVNDRNAKKRCEIFSKLAIKTLERRQWHRFGVCIVDFKQVNVNWVNTICKSWYIWNWGFYLTNTSLFSIIAWKVFEFGVFLVRIFPHSDSVFCVQSEWIRKTRKRTLFMQYVLQRFSRSSWKLLVRLHV